MTQAAARLLRRAEIALWVIGIALLGVALAATLSRWNYQAQQERALFAQPLLPVVSEAAPQPAVAADHPKSLTAIGAPRVEVATSRRVSDAEHAPRREPAADPTALGRIEIDRVGVAAIVKEGADEETLSRAVGLVPGSARPGEVGNMVLAGHRDTFFRPLRRVRLNDRIRLTVPPNVYEYRVQSVRVVEPEETSVLDSKGVEELTLVTCYPFRYFGASPERFIVSATRVN